MPARGVEQDGGKSVCGQNSLGSRIACSDVRGSVVGTVSFHTLFVARASSSDKKRARCLEQRALLNSLLLCLDRVRT